MPKKDYVHDKGLVKKMRSEMKEDVNYSCPNAKTCSATPMIFINKTPIYVDAAGGGDLTFLQYSCIYSDHCTYVDSFPVAIESDTLHRINIVDV